MLVYIVVDDFDWWVSRTYKIIAFFCKFHHTKDLRLDTFQHFKIPIKKGVNYNCSFICTLFTRLTEPIFATLFPFREQFPFSHRNSTEDWKSLKYPPKYNFQEI
jgi:hypothetical protein